MVMEGSSYQLLGRSRALAAALPGGQLAEIEVLAQEYDAAVAADVAMFVISRVGAAVPTKNPPTALRRV
jgi:hypothetical protein